MSFRIHRSFTFWLGLFGTVFIAWAWMRSMSEWSQLIWQYNTRDNILAAQSNGQVWVTWTVPSPPSSKPELQYSEGPYEGEVAWFREAFDLSQIPDLISVAHWFLLLLFLIPWLGLIAWQWRRTKRIENATNRRAISAR